MQSVYDVYVTENNVPGAYIYAVSAVDPDVGQNAYVTYSILECEIQGMSILTYVSINSENGYLYALRSFDYEQIKEFSFMVHAKDSGAPELTANATVNVIIVDQNDNAPSIIAPLGKKRHCEGTFAPLSRAGIPGDPYCGHGCGWRWERAPVVQHPPRKRARDVRMDWRNRWVTHRAPVSSKRDPPHPYDLLIEVRDHGQPPLSSSASINVVLVDSIVEGRSGDRGSVKSKEGSLDLTLILIIALGSVSFIFLLAMIVLGCAVRRKRNWTSTRAWPETRAVSAAVAKRAGARRSSVNRTSCSSRALTWPVPAQVPVEESGSFGSHHQNQNYCYQVCLTPESAKTDLMFLKTVQPIPEHRHRAQPVRGNRYRIRGSATSIISNGSILSSEVKTHFITYPGNTLS